MASRMTAKSREPDVLSAAYLEGTSNKVRFMICLVVVVFQLLHAHASFHFQERLGDDTEKNDTNNVAMYDVSSRQLSIHKSLAV